MSRAVSPVIATILLLVITVGVAAGFYTWFNSLKETQEEKGGEKSAELIRQTKASIKIIDLKNYSGAVKVVVWNNGDIKLTNVTLYVNEIQDGTLASLDKNEISNITSSLITKANTKYNLKVASAEGAEATYRGEV